MQDLNTRPQRHIPALDGIRGIAILMVLGVHLLFLGEFPQAPPVWLSAFHILNFGWMGVDLFFVLSGFLITGILLDTKKSQNYFRSFYGRRTLRIFPLYYLVVIAWLLTLSLQQRYIAWVGVPSQLMRYSYLVYLNNWVFPLQHGPAGMLGAFWSLAVEEQFYLVWPAVVLLLSEGQVVRVCAFICTLLPLLRFGLDYVNQTLVFMSTLTRMDTLMWGALAAIAVRSPGVLPRLRPWLKPSMACCAVAMLCIAFPLHEFYARSWWTQSIGFSIIAAGFTAFLLCAYDSDSTDGVLAHALRARWLRAFGRYSYALYVLHGFVLISFEQRFKNEPWFGHSLGRGLLVFGAALAICYTLSWLSFVLYERPFLRLKRYFEPDSRNPRTLPQYGSLGSSALAVLGD